MPNTTNPPIVPAARPRLSSTQLKQRMAAFNIDREKYPLIIVGIRGYYKKSLGQPSANDRGIYDDALFIDTPNSTTAFNGNTDPSRYRLGQGRGKAKGAGKGMASLQPGLWLAHAFGRHKGQYLALVQSQNSVMVLRDGNPPYLDTGYFGINIHRGSYTSTSSLGCQTIHPQQWPAFIALAKAEAIRLYGAQWATQTVPYLLLEA